MSGLSATGGCLCGEVRFLVDVSPVLTMACHCRQCQRMTASAFSLSALFAVSGFALTAGRTVMGGLHSAVRHHHCPTCLAWLFTHPEGLDDFVNVRATLFDEPGVLAEPFVEVWTDQRVRWATTVARRSFGALPDPAAFMTLVREYAANRH